MAYSYCSKHKDYFILSEIGTGWASAIINSTSEYTFIEKQHQLLHNNISFWIGGATIADGKIELSDYIKHSPCAGRYYKYNCIFCKNLEDISVVQSFLDIFLQM